MDLNIVFLCESKTKLKVPFQKMPLKLSSTCFLYIYIGSGYLIKTVGNLLQNIIFKRQIRKL